MTAIALNSALMAMNIFPAPLVWWDNFLHIGKLCFFVIFTLEFVLKFYALRGAYWEEGWNQFDFFCILVSATGYILEWTNTLNISSFTSIFRVARLFRLMRLMKGVKQIFAALAMSVPKLLNVVLILLLLLVLYSILGVSLFSTLKAGETLDEHGNFRSFGYAFITLFRASTGEAWNEIMHDLAKSPNDHYRKGSWCTPDYLFQPDNEETWKVLNSKCLIEKPNVCVVPWFNGVLLPIVYWGTYTLIVAIMVMNLVIAVILESYEEGKNTRDGDTIEAAIEVWKKYDPNQTLYIPLNDAVPYIYEVLNLVMVDENDNARKTSEVWRKGCSGRTTRASQIPMKFVKALNIRIDDNKVNFFNTLQEVMKLVCAQTDAEAIHEIDKFQVHDEKSLAKMKLKEKALSAVQSSQDEVERKPTLQEHIAAMKIQKVLRDRRANKAKQERDEVNLT